LTNTALLIILCAPVAAIAIGMFVIGISFKVDEKLFRDERED
jgi:hypothetical protein